MKSGGKGERDFVYGRNVSPEYKTICCLKEESLQPPSIAGMEGVVVVKVFPWGTWKIMD